MDPRASEHSSETRQNLRAPVRSQSSARRPRLPNSKPRDLSAWRAGSGVNPVLRSRLPEQIFPLVTSPKTNTRGRAGRCKRESASQERRVEFGLWRGRRCFKQRCLLQQSKNSQAGRGGGCSGSSRMEKRLFEVWLGDKERVHCFLGRAGSPCVCFQLAPPARPPGSAPAPGRGRSSDGTKAELQRWAAARARAGRGPQRGSCLSLPQRRAGT